MEVTVTKHRGPEWIVWKTGAHFSDCNVNLTELEKDQIAAWQDFNARYQVSDYWHENKMRHFVFQAELDDDDALHHRDYLRGRLEENGFTVTDKYIHGCYCDTNMLDASRTWLPHTHQCGCEYEAKGCRCSWLVDNAVRHARWKMERDAYMNALSVETGRPG